MGDKEGSVAMSDQLQSVLSNLYDFGDGFVSRGKKKKTKTNTNPACQESQRLQKSEVTANVSGSEEYLAPSTVCSEGKKKNASLFFKAIKDELSGQSKVVESHDGSVSEQGEHSIEIVTFSSYRKKKKIKVQDEKRMNTETNLENNEKEKSREIFNFEKARLDVHKFGITGYKKDKQRTFEKERAIMLGARPPKKEYFNYKVYQEMIKEKEAQKREESRTENNFEATKKRKKHGEGGRKTKKARTSGAVVPTGHVGKFKNGALILSGKDIKTIKQSKVIK
ncbi:40S small subunit processome assembly factor 1 [Pelodytes ibericus]